MGIVTAFFDIFNNLLVKFWPGTFRWHSSSENEWRKDFESFVQLTISDVRSVQNLRTLFLSTRVIGDNLQFIIIRLFSVAFENLRHHLVSCSIHLQKKNVGDEVGGAFRNVFDAGEVLSR